MDIRLSRLRTFSGDIDRVKFMRRNKDPFGDFELISDQQIESMNYYSMYLEEIKGLDIFLNQDHVNLYWVSSSNGTVITQDSVNYLLNSVEISGSNQGVNEFCNLRTDRFSTN